MKSKDAVAHLETAIDEARRLQSMPRRERRFDSWYDNTRIAVEHIFGAGSRQQKDFENVNYSLPIWTSDTPDHVFDGAEVSGLRRAESLLTAFKNEIEKFGRPDESTAPPGKTPASVIELDKITIPMLLHGIGRLTIKSWILVWSVVVAIFSLGMATQSFRTAPNARALRDSIRLAERQITGLRMDSLDASRRIRIADSVARANAPKIPVGGNPQ